MIGGLPDETLQGIVRELLSELERAVSSIALGLTLAAALALLARRTRPGAVRIALWAGVAVTGIASVAAAIWLTALLVAI